jgi:hypothetical protein
MLKGTAITAASLTYDRDHTIRVLEMALDFGKQAAFLLMNMTAFMGTKL